jgi:hypothetical protein
MRKAQGVDHWPMGFTFDSGPALFERHTWPCAANTLESVGQVGHQYSAISVVVERRRPD